MGFENETPKTKLPEARRMLRSGRAPHSTCRCAQSRAARSPLALRSRSTPPPRRRCRRSAGPTHTGRSGGGGRRRSERVTRGDIASPWLRGQRDTAGRARSRRIGLHARQQREPRRQSRHGVVKSLLRRHRCPAKPRHSGLRERPWRAAAAW